MRKVTPAALCGLLFIMFGCFLLYPIWLTVQGGFVSSKGGGLTVHHIWSVFADASLRAGLLNAFGSCPPFPATCPEDITPFEGNGVVNIDDIVALLNAFGGCP